MVNILTLKWGTLYGPHYVNRLFAGVKKNLDQPFRFVCFTDDPTGLDPRVDAQPLPEIDLGRMHRTTWIKLALFQTGLVNLSGTCLFLDLDLLITGNMDCFFDYKPGKRCITQNWVQTHQRFIKQRPDVGNSSVVRFDSGTTQFIVDKFISERDWAYENFHPEQVYLTYALGEKHYFPDEWVASFKRHCVPTFPLNLVLEPKMRPEAKMVVFHGNPNPDVAITGNMKTRLHRRTKPAPWVEQYWQAESA